jgi:PST family polysaccharide transporter
VAADPDQPATDAPAKSSHREILRASAIIGGASVINILVGLLRIKAAAVLLGPAGVGLIGILQNMIATASGLASLGFGNAGTRQIAQANGNGEQAGVDAARRALFWGTLVLALVGGCIFWALREVIADWVLADITLADDVGWLALGVILTVAASSQNALLNGMRRIGDIARVRVVSSLAGMLIGVAALYWLGEDGLLVFIVSSPLASFVISHVYVARLPKIQSPKTPVKVLTGQWQTLVRLGFAFMVAGLATTIGQLVVRSIVQNNLGAEALGYFQAAWTISMTYLGVVLGGMATDYYPRLTAAIHDHKRASQLVNEQSEVSILLAGPVLLGMLALVPWVLTLLYSSDFAPAAAVLRWQILGDVLKVVSWPLGFIIVASGAGRVFMFAECSAVVVFVLVTWFALPFMGIEATGIGFFAMYLAYLPLVFWLGARRIGFRWSRTVKRDSLILITLACITALAGDWQDWLGAVIGLCSALIFGLMALARLAQMAELGGLIGKLAGISRRILKSTGF